MFPRFKESALLLAESVDKACMHNLGELVAKVSAFLTKYNFPLILVRHPRTHKVVSILTTDCIFITEDMIRHLGAMRCLIERCLSVYA